MESQESVVSVTVPSSVQELYASKCTKFDPLWVQVLINLRMKYSKLFTRRRNSASEGWRLVFEELKESGAPEYISIAKIKKKWMNLMTRYRQIKNTTLNPETITWPYFEQMDRAFGKETESDLNGKFVDSSLNQSIINEERQSFMKKLIELRYRHRHLFTGRKYTARDGWMIIQSLLQCQGKYSIDQLSKCWQNLVQRYKQLARGESSQNITWPYFEYMHKWFQDNKLQDAKLEMDVGEIIESENKDDEKDEADVGETRNGSMEFQTKHNLSLDRIKIQLLTEIKAQQEKYHSVVMESLKNVTSQISSLKHNLSSIPVDDKDVE
ncbi:unnamed protein product [Phyllotreta striolata]|uniref:Myb/SANT-like DNA-binding domain-containing protein n=1 Tax=Phyllotreta striolata TaxID=444603 RepID=A0A9N9TGG5_PHYSR|nr:unnamed protein product [Phyllotreta striolata]